MSLENGILGYLSLRTMSGYDIKKLFDQSAAFFWPADQAQIYRSMKKLLADGLIELLGVSKGDGPDRKEYAITDKGREALRRCLLSPEPTDFIVRAPYVMQLFFSGLLSHEEQLVFLDEQLRISRGLIDKLESGWHEKIKAYADTAGLDEDDPKLTASVWAYKWGLLRSQAYTELLENMKAEVKEKLAL